jgi:hypothetical protein
MAVLRGVGYVVVGLFALTVIGGLAGWWEPDGESEAPAEPAAKVPVDSAPADEPAIRLSEAEVRGAIEKTAGAFVAAHGHELGALEITIEDQSVKVRVELANTTPAMMPTENRKIAHAAVKLVLDALIEAGHDPHEEWIYVSGYVYQPMKEKSPTGRALFRTHASASYNFSADAIEVKAYNP